MSQPLNQHIILMGVSGAGKTTVGHALAQHLDIHFIDADDHHPPANRQKMAVGQPLTDADRKPWLIALANLLADAPPAVLACSALRHAYRQQLASACTPEPRFVWLDVPEPILRHRMQQRDTTGQHFMPATQLRNQLDTLEPPQPDETILHLPADQPVDTLVNQITQSLMTPTPPTTPQ